MSSYRPYQNIDRRKSRKIFVGSVPVGGDSPITVQTMTNTLTTDVAATVAQIKRCERAGDTVQVADSGLTAGKNVLPRGAGLRTPYRRGRDRQLNPLKSLRKSARREVGPHLLALF